MGIQMILFVTTLFNNLDQDFFTYLDIAVYTLCQIICFGSIAVVFAYFTFLYISPYNFFQCVISVLFQIHSSAPPSSFHLPSPVPSNLASPSPPSISVGLGLLHGNFHFARQFRWFTRQFKNSNDNLTMIRFQELKDVLKYEIRLE